jgi:hypothetical protein
MLRIPHCLDNQLTDSDKAVSPTHWPHFIPQKHFFRFWYSFLILSKPQGLVRPEGLGKLRKIHTPHWVSNTRPSSLQRSALTTKLPRAPVKVKDKPLNLFIKYTVPRSNVILYFEKNTTNTTDLWKIGVLTTHSKRELFEMYISTANTMHDLT